MTTRYADCHRFSPHGVRKNRKKCEITVPETSEVMAVVLAAAIFPPTGRAKWCMDASIGSMLPMPLTVRKSEGNE